VGRKITAVMLILLGLFITFLDSLWLPRQAIYGKNLLNRELYALTPYLILAVDPPAGLTQSDVRPQIDLTLDANLIRPDAIRGTLQVSYSERFYRVAERANAVEPHLTIGVQGPASMKVEPGEECDSPSVMGNEVIKSVKFSPGICRTPQFEDGFKFEIPHGDYVPSLPVGLARDRFAIEMPTYGIRGSGATFMPESKFVPVESYTLTFRLEEGTLEFAQSTPDPTFTEEYSRSWDVIPKRAPRPDSNFFFSATVIHTFWNSILGWISSIVFLGFGFFLGSMELKRRKAQENQVEVG
jgi:hypothetical protein